MTNNHSQSVNYNISNEHNNCVLEDTSKINDYLKCSKMSFEYRLNQQPMNESSLDDFVLHKTIGLGAFGRVMLVNHKSDPKKFLAMKVRKLIIIYKSLVTDKTMHMLCMFQSLLLNLYLNTCYKLLFYISSPAKCALCVTLRAVQTINLLSNTQKLIIQTITVLIENTRCSFSNHYPSRDHNLLKSIVPLLHRLKLKNT